MVLVIKWRGLLPLVAEYIQWEVARRWLSRVHTSRSSASGSSAPLVYDQPHPIGTFSCSNKSEAPIHQLAASLFRFSSDKHHQVQVMDSWSIVKSFQWISRVILSQTFLYLTEFIENSITLGIHLFRNGVGNLQG
jgi:hypothetical protein